MAKASQGNTWVEKAALIVSTAAAVGILGNFLVTWKNSSAISQAQQRLDGLEFTVTDSRDLRRGLRKPLEGVWKYSMKYDRLWGEDGQWEAYGKAVFIWQPDERSYLVLIGASLVATDGGLRDKAQRGQFVTWLFEADLPAESDSGWPAEPFNLECEYRSRTVAEGGMEAPGEAYARFTGIEVARKNEREAFRLKGNYVASGGQTRGELSFTRLQ